MSVNVVPLVDTCHWYVWLVPNDAPCSEKLAILPAQIEVVEASVVPAVGGEVQGPPGVYVTRSVGRRSPYKAAVRAVVLVKAALLAVPRAKPAAGLVTKLITAEAVPYFSWSESTSRLPPVYTNGWLSVTLK